MEHAENLSGDTAQEAQADSAPGRAMRVAAALQAKGGEEFAKPGSIVEIKFVKGQSLSLTASRLLALMILTAGGDAWQDRPHRMRKADIRRGHKGNERISDMLEELHRTLFAIDDRSWRGKKATLRFSLISSSREEAEDTDGADAGWIEWEFTPDARKLIQESESYAVLNRQAVLGFRSSYALKLYEIGSLRLHRRQSTWKGDMAALRAALGISPDVYKDFAQLRRKVLEKAKAEIDQLAHFRVEWKEIRQGRTVTEIEFRFEPKDAPAQIATVDEIERHSTGRKARREETVETIADTLAVGSMVKAAVSSLTSSEKGTEIMFPQGTIRFNAEALAAIARSHGGGWDIDLIADAYRQQMGDRLAKLKGAKLISSWTGFCESFVARRGRP
ncbi:replication initiation protein [Sphingobium baderi LL03]|uniref:Replication initiation protein n=3 Tax=Alphaproteobacteria TaxID=28211 RepID=A0A0J7XJT1_9SPHN|nr:replication initiation protein [Sphingobium baderi LL03]KMS51363.1 replication initiation protein [Novosphingobium barchaimii LL02]KMS52953.1 replication initiation protein [Sphingobium baderi LL03]